VDDGAQWQAPAPRYEAPQPFAPPSLRTAPLNEVFVLGRTTYPTSPMQPVVTISTMQPAPMTQPHGDRITRRRTIGVVGVVVLALAAIIAALTIGAAGPVRRSLSLPDTAGEYVRVSTVSGAHIDSIFGNNGTFGSIPHSDLVNAKIAIYARGTQAPPTALFVGFDAADSPTIGRQLHNEDAAQVTNRVLAGAGAVINSLTVDSGPLGGSLRCSAVHFGGVDATVGVWADADTLGVVLLFDPTLGPSLSETGSVTRTFRAQAEH
jgi:hypothetical protein